MNLPLDGIENEYYPSIYHIPFVKWQLINIIRNKAVLCDSEGLQHGLLPEATTPFYCRNGVDDAKCQDAFHRARNQAEGKRLSIVLIPRLDVECESRYTYDISE